MQRLINSYPELFATPRFHHIACRDGWFHLLNSLCSLINIEAASLPVELRGQICFTQIKQKLGGLRVSLTHTTPKMDGAIELAEDLSNNICEICGNFGGHRSISGWIITLCDVHYQEEISRMEQ